MAFSGHIWKSELCQDLLIFQMATDHLLRIFSWDFQPACKDQRERRERSKFDWVCYFDKCVQQKGILGMLLICCYFDRMGLFWTELF